MSSNNVGKILIAAIVAAVIFTAVPANAGCFQQVQAFVQPVVQYQVAVPVIQQVVAQYPVYAVQQQVIQQYAQPVVQQVVVQKQRQRVLFQRAPRVQKIITKQRIVNR